MNGSLQQISLTELPSSIGTPPSARLIESVEHSGVIQPIIVAHIVNADGEIGTAVIDGNRRIAAARKARNQSVPAIVLDGLSPEQISEWTLIANGFRQANYLTEMEALRHLKDRGYSSDDINKISGMAKSSLEVRNRLDGLVPNLLEALRQGRITQADASTASKLDADDQDVLGQHLHRTGSLRRADITRMFPELAAKSSSGDADETEMQQPTKSTLQNLMLEAVSIAGRLEINRDQFLELAANAWDANNRHLD